MKNSRTVLVRLTLLVFGLFLGLVLAQEGGVFSAQMDPVDGFDLVSPKNRPEHGTFWSLQRADWPPLPYNPFPELPVYWLNKERNVFLLDDRSVDYEALYKERLAARMLKAAGLGMSLGEMELMESGGANGPLDYGTNLWLIVSSNSLAVPNQFSVVLTNTVEDQIYAILTKIDLAAPSWTGELVVTGAVGTATTAQLATKERTNLFVWARTCDSANLIVDDSPTAAQLAQLLVGTNVTIANATNTGRQWPGAHLRMVSALACRSTAA